MFEWIWERPVVQPASRDAPEDDRHTVKSTYFQTRMPSGNNLGAVEPVFYVVVGDIVKLCEESGALTGKSRQLKVGDAADSVASRLGWEAWSAGSGASDFNRPIHYPPLGIA